MRSIWCSLCVAALSGGVALAECAEDQAELRWPSGSAVFEIEVADDAVERAEGLMFVEAMPTRSGMLFVYDRPQPVAFWMRNTLIPLDMLFFDETGVLKRVHSNAIPGDETAIPGGNDIQFVLEINGGLAQAFGIQEGAEIRHPSIDDALAAWSCDLD